VLKIEGNKKGDDESPFFRPAYFLPFLWHCIRHGLRQLTRLIATQYVTGDCQQNDFFHSISSKIADERLR